MLSSRTRKKELRALKCNPPSTRRHVCPYGHEDVSHVTCALVKSTLMPTVDAIFTLVYFEKGRSLKNLNFRIVAPDEAEVLHADGEIRRHSRGELIEMLFSRVVHIARDIGLDVADTEKGAVDDLLLFGLSYIRGVPPPYPLSGGGTPPGPLQESLTGKCVDLG